MATPIFSQNDLFLDVDGMVHGKSSQVSQSRQRLVNRAVRYVLADMDLRSAKRSAALSPNIFENQFDYGAPADLKARKIIDFRRQVLRPSSETWMLVDDADFDRLKNVSNRRVAVRDENFSQLLRIDGLPSSTKATIHSCDSLTANGTWAVVAGTDSTNLTRDTLNYITGGASLNFDTNSGATTAAIENSTMTQVDLDDYDEIGSIFCWVYVPATSGLTNFILRWGNDSSNYWSRTVTTNNEALAFYVGWNLLRFDWDGATETGTVAPATVDYLRLTVTKTAGMAADTDWRLDDVTVQTGKIYNVVYYSKYGWQTSAAAYIEESTTTTDLLIADSEEVEMINFKAAEFFAQELRDYDDVVLFRDEYKRLKRIYQARYPSEALKVQRRSGTFKRNW